MTIQDQIDQLKKDILEFSEYLKKRQDQISYSEVKEIEEVKEIVKEKPTRYYPNGAYMDEPEIGTPYWIKGEYSEVISSQEDGFSWDGDRLEMDRLERQEIFPTEKSCKKDRRHDELTAKMYRDMRDERINGDWVADFRDKDQEKYFPLLTEYALRQSNYTNIYTFSHDFYYKNETFIEDLKALGWTEEELKIVWFRV